MSELRNFGATRYMSEEVNFETAALTPVRVRGKIKLASASPEEVVIDIDTHDDSEFVVKFGP